MIYNSWTHRLARRLVRPLVGTWITPNHLTTLRLVTALGACAAFTVLTLAGFLSVRRRLRGPSLTARP